MPAHTCTIDFADPHDSTAPRWQHRFAAPRQLLIATQLAEVRAVLAAVQAAAEQGAWCVGALRYEAAAAFDAALQTHAGDAPLAWFAVYDAPQPQPQPQPPSLSACAADAASAPTLHWHTLPERAAFDAALASIHQSIAAGDYYQVNYTAQTEASVEGHGAVAADTF